MGVYEGKITYSEGSDKPKVVTGVFGGYDPAGNIVMTFYDEHYVFPNQYKVNVSDDSVVEEYTNEGEPLTVTGEAVATLVMNKKTAKSIADWLGSKADGEGK